jgi:hypothetical protein
MENANKVQHRDNSIASRIDYVQPTLIVGIVLIVMLAGLTGFNPSLGITSALVLFLLVLVVPRPVLIVYGLALILPLIGGLARGAVVPILRLGQAMVVFAFILVLLARPSPQGKSRLTAIDLAFVLFFLSEAVVPVLALYYRGEHLDLNDTHNIYGVSPLQTLLGPLLYYILYRLVVATIASESQIKVVLELSFIASIIVSAIGILEQVAPPIRTLVEAYYPPIGGTNSLGRISSTLDFYSGLGAYLVFTIIVALTCYAAGKRLGIHPLLLVATILLGSIALVLTGTFAAWIGFAIGVVAVLVLIGRVPKQALFILLGIALAVIIFQPFFSARLDQQLGTGAAQGLAPQSFAFRIKLWQDLFLPAIGQHLLLGAGPAPAVLNYWSTEESQYLFLLLRGGLFYLFSYLLLIGVAMAACWREIKSKSRDASHWVAIALLVNLIVLNVMNVSGQYFTYVGGTQTIWMLLAIVVASRQFKVLGPVATAEQSGDSRGRVGSTGLYKPLNKMTTTLVGESADGLLTRNDFLPSSMSKATRPYRNTPPLERS